MASGLLDEPLRKPTDMVRPRPEIHPTQMEKPTQRSLLDEPIRQPTVLQILDPSTMKEPVGSGAIWAIFSRNGEYVSGPFYTEEEAQTAEMVLYGLLGDSPVSEYQEMGKDLNYQETHFKASQAPRIIEQGVEETPLKERIKEALRDIIGDTAEGLLGLSPISDAGAADNPLPYVDGYTPDTFLDNWQKYYWAGEGVGQLPKEPEWLENQKDKIAQGTVFPSSVSALVSGAIDKAVDIFGEDIGKDKPRRYSADRLRNDLVNTGWIESDYVHLAARPTRKNPNPSDSGYWQMQPLTAYDLLRSAKAHFYDPKKTTKFEQNFGSYHDLLKLSVDDLKKKLRDKDEQDFAAALAAVKIITTFDY